jgi:hypothetical protein
MALAFIGGCFGLVFGLLALAVGVLGVVFWIWMIIDCATNEPRESTDKVVWIIIIVFTYLIGAAIYYFVRRPRRIAEFGR